jgi:hypothetical protein
MKKNFILTSLTILLILLPISMFSQSLEDNKIEFSINGGVLLPGRVKGSYHSDFNPDSTITIKNKISPLLKIVADYNLSPKFSLGLNINYAKFNINDVLYKDNSIKSGNEVNIGTWDGREHIIPFDDIKMLEINGSIKRRFILNDNMVLKPSLYIGFRKTFSSSPDAEEKGVVLNYCIEYQYYIQNIFLSADIGFVSQPYGGVEHVGYVRTIGVPYIGIGVGISL